MVPTYWMVLILAVASLPLGFFFYYLAKKKRHRAGISIFLFFVLLAIDYALYYYNDSVMREIKTPKMKVSILIPGDILEYKHLLKEFPVEQYIIGIGNKNKDSSPVEDMSIEFHFPNIISEIGQGVYLDTGGNLVWGARGYTQNSNGIKTFHELPPETPAARAMNLSIHKWRENNEVAHSNIAVFNCQKWPKGAIFDGTIVTNLKTKPKYGKIEGKIGKYGGQYYYEINGKRYEEKIEGMIPSPNTDRRFAEHHYERGSNFMKEGSVDAAVSEFDEAIRLNPEHDHGHFKRAFCFAALGKHGEAFAGFSRVIKISPKYAKAYFYRSIVRKELRHAKEEVEKDLYMACVLKFDKACKELFSEVDPNDGFFSISSSDEGWLERNNNFVEIIPHITRQDFEFHLYRDTDNVLKALITNSFSKKAMLTYEDLERLKTHRTHPKHNIKVTWYQGENKLYIDEVLVDVYPKEIDSSLVKLREGLFKVGPSDGDVFRSLCHIGPEKGRIGFDISKEDWLENNGEFINIFPHIYISEKDFEVHGYRDEEYVFNFLISTSYSRNVILQFSDLDGLKNHAEHHRHFVQVAWHNEEKKLYINEGEPVDTYPGKR